jgi:hypothetical protein
LEDIRYNDIVVNSIVDMEVNMSKVNDLLIAAIEETKSLQSGEEFLVKDLFKGYSWNRIAVKDRLLLGTLFLNHFSSAGQSVEVIGKTSSNQQKYRKE